jgi:hypothetical protein
MTTKPGDGCHAAAKSLRRAVEADGVALAAIAYIAHLKHTTGSVISVDASRHL